MKKPTREKVGVWGKYGKLAEGSDKSVPILGNQAESSDKAETMELWYISPRFVHFWAQG
jgi:hypothetical protein